MNLQQQAQHMNRIIKLHQNLLREVRYGEHIVIPLSRDDGGEDVLIRSPRDLATLPIGTRVGVYGNEFQVTPDGMAFLACKEIAYTFDDFWDEMVAYSAYPPRRPEAMPRITHMPDTEHN